VKSMLRGGLVFAALGLCGSVMLSGCGPRDVFGGRASPAEVMAGQVKKLEDLCGDKRWTCKVSRRRAIGPFSEVVVADVAGWGTSNRFAMLVDGSADQARPASEVWRDSDFERASFKLFGSPSASTGGAERGGRFIAFISPEDQGEPKGGVDDRPIAQTDGCLVWLLEDRLQGPQPRKRPVCENTR